MTCKQLLKYFLFYLKSKLFDILRKKRNEIEILSIDRVLNKEHFHGKIMKKCVPKATSIIPFNFGK